MAFELAGAIYATRVSAAGVVTDVTGVPVAATSGNQSVAIASANGKTMIAWQHTSSSSATAVTYASFNGATA